MIRTREDACEAYRALRHNYTQAGKRALYNTIRTIFVDFHDATDNRIQKWLRRKTGVVLRKCETKSDRINAAIRDVLGPAIASHAKDSHDKGAGEYSISQRRNLIRGAMRAPAIIEVIESHPDLRGRDLPSVEKIETLLRARFGPASRENYRDHLERCIGFRAEYAGQVIIVDATGWPVTYRTGEVRGRQKAWLFLAADVASAHLWVSETVATSESEGWRPQDNPGAQDVMLQFARALGFWPEWLINDKISTLTTRLSSIGKGGHPSEYLSLGTLLWFAGGVRPYVRMGGRPTGGAAVESAVRSLKGKLAEISTAKAIQKECDGLGSRAITEYDSRLEFIAAKTQAVAELNARVLSRRGCPLTREQLLQIERGVQARDNRAQAGDLWDCVDPATGEVMETGVPKWRRIVAAAKPGQIIRGRVSMKLNGKPWTAEVTAPDGGWDFSVEEKDALILPPGARHNDDPESFRLIVIDDERGNPRYQTATAKAIKVDEYWQDLSYPVIGQYKALPWNRADHDADRRDASAKVWRREINPQPLKEGTNDGLARVVCG